MPSRRRGTSAVSVISHGVVLLLTVERELSYDMQVLVDVLDGRDVSSDSSLIAMPNVVRITGTSEVESLQSRHPNLDQSRYRHMLLTLFTAEKLTLRRWTSTYVVWTMDVCPLGPWDV